MTTPPFTIDGTPIRLPSPRGWKRLRAELGMHYIPRHGVRLVAGTKAQTFRLGAYGRTFDVVMQPRGICTIRPDTKDVREMEVPGLGYEDFRGGGVGGIDPYGTPGGTIHDHDATMRRCPIETLDMATGAPRTRVDASGYNLVRFATLPGYDPGTGRKCPDGQHAVRAVRFAVLFMDDPWVRMDLKALARDCALAWSAPFERSMLALPKGRGNGACGREAAWVAFIASLAGHRQLIARMGRILTHVAMPWGGTLRNVYGSYWGSPHPWASPPGGSGVDPTIDVAQDLECDLMVLALDSIGQRRAAAKLAATVLKKPLRKWIDCDTALGVGSHYADLPQGWIGLSAVARWDPRTAVEYAKKWPIPTPGGSQVGPFTDLTKIRKALQEWGAWGKMRPWYEATA